MATPSTAPPHTTSKPTPRPAASALTPAASSPPRSVPSPAYHSKVGKSPHKPRSTAHTPLGGGTNAHTPTPSGLFHADSSPAVDGSQGLSARGRAGTLGAKSIAGGGVSEEATPAALSGLGLGLGPAGSGSSGAHGPSAALLALGLRDARDAEEQYAQRARGVLATLGTRWGRVCQDNVGRCVKRVGDLECLWEDGSRPPDANGNKPRTLSIAGSEILVEIEWSGDEVKSVALSFPKATGDAVHDENGSRILLRDLTGWSSDGGYVPLDRFVANLERLARTDRLGRDKVSCFEALEGIYASLKKLWDYELEQEKDGKGLAEVEVLCSKSGRPSKHPTEALGPRVDYWLERRLLLQGNPNFDSPGAKDQRAKCWTLQIGCEAFDASQYPPIRVSTAWIGDEVRATVPAEEAFAPGATFINWHEPAASFIPVALDGSDPMALDIPSHILPDVRFVAKLDPPLTLPLKTAIEIFAHVGQPLPQDAMDTATLASLLFPGNAQAPDALQRVKDPHLYFTRTVPSFSKATRQTSRYMFRVLNPPDLWAKTITEIPFSHPRQLVEVLPTLRQWAFFTRLLQRSVLDEELDESIAIEKKEDSATNGEEHRGKATAGGPQRYESSWSPPSDTESEGEIEHSSFPTCRRKSSAKAKAMIDISFTCPPLTQRIDVDLVVPLPSEANAAKASFHILPNAEVEASNAQGLSFANRDVRVKLEGGGPSDSMDVDFSWDEQGARTSERLGKVLTISEDLGALVEWMRRRQET